MRVVDSLTSLDILIPNHKLWKANKGRETFYRQVEKSSFKIEAKKDQTVIEPYNLYQ